MDKMPQGKQESIRNPETLRRSSFKFNSFSPFWNRHRIAYLALLHGMKANQLQIMRLTTERGSIISFEPFQQQYLIERDCYKILFRPLHFVVLCVVFILKYLTIKKFIVGNVEKVNLKPGFILFLFSTNRPFTIITLSCTAHRTYDACVLCNLCTPLLYATKSLLRTGWLCISIDGGIAQYGVEECIKT